MTFRFVQSILALHPAIDPVPSSKSTGRFQTIPSEKCPRRYAIGTNRGIMIIIITIQGRLFRLRIVGQLPRIGLYKLREALNDQFWDKKGIKIISLVNKRISKIQTDRLTLHAGLDKYDATSCKALRTLQPLHEVCLEVLLHVLLQKQLWSDHP